MSLAREGVREILIATLLLGGLAAAGAWLHWAAAIPFVAVWLWVLWFFRDPVRVRAFGPGELCSAADGTVTEVTLLDHDEIVGGPAVRIGVFLSLFNVHINRFPCSGVVRAIEYKPGKFLDARHPDSGRLNEANTLLIDPDGGLPGPVSVRQVAGLVARRIICHAEEGGRARLGEKFGMIKFGSRTELVLPRVEKTVVAVEIGDKVRAGITVVARQPVPAPERTEGTENMAPAAVAGSRN